MPVAFKVSSSHEGPNRRVPTRTQHKGKKTIGNFRWLPILKTRGERGPVSSECIGTLIGMDHEGIPTLREGKMRDPDCLAEFAVHRAGWLVVAHRG